MANSEDYLDSLLNSVQTVRKDVTDAQKQTEAILREKQEQRNRIKPDDDFMEAIGHWIKAGKPVCMATQVTHEGSDMEVYQVGKIIKERFPVLESYDMTLEASVTKMMWALGQTEDPAEVKEIFARNYCGEVSGRL